MRRRAKRFLCHDCGIVLVADDRLHYVYQCHACAAGEHELMVLARRDPGHPDVERLLAGPVDLTASSRKIDLNRAAA